jgi:hypothetical protein
MIQIHSSSDQDQVVDTMIDLTRLSSLHRAIVGGAGSIELCTAFRRRGYTNVTTPAAGRLARGLHTVGLIMGDSSIGAIDVALMELAPFLCASASVAVLIGTHENGCGIRIRARLEQMGFRIEAGVRCRRGLVLSAYRQGPVVLRKAA